MTPNPRVIPLIALLVSVLALFVSASPAAAHDATDEAILVVVDTERAVITAPIPFAELGYTDTDGDGLLGTDELNAQVADVAGSLVTIARQNVAITIDGTEVEIAGAGVPSVSIVGHDDDAEVTDPSEYAVLVLASEPLTGDLDELVLDWTFPGPTENVLLSHPDGALTGKLSEDGTATFSFGAWPSAVSFFDLGVEHIQFGPDHLLFLLVLTLAAVGSRQSKTEDNITLSATWRVVKLVTAFTIGHAISLCLAYFEVISVPASIVEPAIAISIVIAAVLAIWGSGAEARPWLAGIVGIVHGLGFASNLDSLGVVASQRVPALAAFNVGIDVAQTVVVLLILAALWVCAKVLRERVEWVRIVAALGAGGFGLMWTITRIADFSGLT